MMEIIIVKDPEFRFGYLAGFRPVFFDLTDGSEKIDSGFGIGIEIFKSFDNVLPVFQILLLLFFLSFLVGIMFFPEDVV